MNKISIAEVQEALARSKVEPAQQEQVINHLQEVIKELEAEKEQQNPVVKTKNKFGVIILDETGEHIVDNLAALVFQIPETEDYTTVADRLKKVALEFNSTKKGIKNPITTLVDLFQDAKPKMFKNQNVIRKTKDLVPVLKSNGKI